MDNQENDIIVSVFCLAYNHEKFIEKTLEGFVCQKTSFRFEVFVHDDASTDNTAEIIRRYAEKYPEIIKPIYQTENQYSKKVGIIRTFLLPQAKGEYLAWCEGDDYWCDENKLQRQVEALEEHPDCVACFSRVKCVDINGNPVGWYIPSFDSDSHVIPGDRYVNYCLNPAIRKTPIFQISGQIIPKSVYVSYCDDPPEFRKYFDVGDYPLSLYLGLQGDVYYMKDVFSCYRVGNPESWAGKHKTDLSRFVRHIDVENHALEVFDEETMYKYHENVVVAINQRLYLMYERLHDIKGMKRPELRSMYNTLTRREKTIFHMYYYFPRATEWLKTAYRNYRDRREKTMST